MEKLFLDRPTLKFLKRLHEAWIFFSPPNIWYKSDLVHHKSWQFNRMHYVRYTCHCPSFHCRSIHYGGIHFYFSVSCEIGTFTFAKKNYSRDHIKPENFRIRSAWTNFYQTKYICREKISKTIIQEKKFKKTFLKKTFFPHEKNNFRYFLCPPRSLLVDPLHSSIGFSCNVGMTQTKKEANKKHTESK